MVLDALSIKKAQKPYVIGSLSPKALKSVSFEGKECHCRGTGLGSEVKVTDSQVLGSP